MTPYFDLEGNLRFLQSLQSLNYEIYQSMAVAHKHWRTFGCLRWLFGASALLCLLSQATAQLCTSPNFACRSNSSVCVPRIKWQDGETDCPDASDEECLTWQYDCKFGKPRCVNLLNLNDGSIDCASGFDEACEAHFFICMDRSDCIEPNRYLDGQMDCRDGSDEPCPAAHFLCHDRSECVHERRFQDGTADCRDGSDEECTLFQFQCRCGNPRCVAADRYDDGVRDCADGSDEPKQHTSAGNKCTDGSPARTDTVVAPSPPPGPPMVTCGPKDLNVCRQDLGEMCLIIAGAPRCMCQMGRIRPAGGIRCIPVETMVEQTTKSHRRLSPRQHPTVSRRDDSTNNNGTAVSIFIPRKTTKTNERLEVLKATVTPLDVSTCSNSDIRRLCPGSNEVCRPVNGSNACVCRSGFTRHPNSGVCIGLLDECSEASLNDCDPNAVCMDNPIAYECLCRPGYIDMSEVPRTKPGMRCLPLVNECASSGTNDCDLNARCIDLPGGYSCECRRGFLDVSPDSDAPGRICTTKKNECLTSEHDCHQFAVCTDTLEGFQCRCPIGFVDLSADPVNRPGRQCAQLINECGSTNDCDSVNGECTDTAEGYLCACKTGYIDADPRGLPGTNCTVGTNPCLDYTLHDCDRKADCRSERPGEFACRCPVGTVDVSKDRERFPGRTCKPLEDECQLGSHDCDTNALCRDTAEAFTCECRQGFRDNSPNVANKPGRRCQPAQSCSTLRCPSDAECRKTSFGAVCQCRQGFIDVSSMRGKPQGSICKKLVNECSSKTQNDCSPNSDCIDSAESFICRCKDGFRDESPDVLRRPGRVCVKTFEPPPPECDVDDPLSCDRTRSEVCVFADGTYKCQCPRDVTRLPDGRCLARNECADRRLNNCAPEGSQCIDQADGYTCQCLSGYVDVSPKEMKPGRICKRRVNECRDPSRYRVDCDRNAVCVDTEESYNCRCNHGFADVSDAYNRLPGRRCVRAINECDDAKLNDCSKNANCEDAKEGYTCRCRAGFVDASRNVTHFPGRVCNDLKPVVKPGGTTEAPFQLESCDPNNARSCRGGAAEVCTDRLRRGQFVCECAPSYHRFEGVCKVFSACEQNQVHDCDPNALCSNVFNAYSCQCKPGYFDTSPDPYSKPGRKCVELRNECADRSQHDCSPFAMCIDARNGYACMCQSGYVDISSTFNKPPGRHCHNASNECAAASLNSCDEGRASCIETPDGYTCKCFDGFADVSSGANLPPGRVCTVQTVCPKQTTDLMFLVDGSGSIGSFVFKNEVLRFVREFVELFDVGPSNTHVAVIQYSDQIRHEFDLGQYKNQAGVLQGIRDIQYLTGLTRTGAALEHMVREGFSARRGARPLSNKADVVRIAIVITDGRSQDNVTEPAIQARAAGVKLFAIGVTDHVLKSELRLIAGRDDHYYHVDDFTDLDTRLRSQIQKEACKGGIKPTQPPIEHCDPVTHNGCNRAQNEICVTRAGRFMCECPAHFRRNPATGICGGKRCDPRLSADCPEPEICRQTPLGPYRCACPDGYTRDANGFCQSGTTTGIPQVECRIGIPNSCPKNQFCRRRIDNSGNECVCNSGFVVDRHGNCVRPGSCDPNDANSCGIRTRRQCLPHRSGQYHTCQCPSTYTWDSVQNICLIDECRRNTHDCSPIGGVCTDIADGFLCACGPKFIDQSPDQINKPGRVCIDLNIDECKLGTHRCHRDAICTDTPNGYVCRCKAGFVDYSPNPRKESGRDCRPLVDECKLQRHDCHTNADCIDTQDSYICICKAGFRDVERLTRPGRNCERIDVNPCSSNEDDCHRSATCVPTGLKTYTCQCLANYRDVSPDKRNRPGRECTPIVQECQNPRDNDCDSPDRANCFDLDEGYRCQCKPGFLDISPDRNTRPGRLCQPLKNECLLNEHDCARDGGVCRDTPDSYDCSCAPDYFDVSPQKTTRPGRRCKKLVNECQEPERNDCSPNAECVDTRDSYICRCLENHHDQSPDPQRKPGRICIPIVNECLLSSTNDCSRNAICTDTLEAYRCRCQTGYIDESPDQNTRPGRICRKKHVPKNECLLGTHDCHLQAICLDRANGFTCRCKDGFFDRSSDVITRPGRNCVLKPTVAPPECRVELANDCKVHLKEVCRLVNGQPKCTCPENYRRHPTTNACTVIDECRFPQLNDCSTNALCVDETDGYRCQCNPGFKDLDPARPGRRCQQAVNECLRDDLNDCDKQAADCTDTDTGEGYTCRCRQGYLDQSPETSRRPGRYCLKLVNECNDPTLNTCDPNAICTDQPQGYKCECPSGYIDISPTQANRGRQCKKLQNECSNPQWNDCDPIAKCVDTEQSYRCECPFNSRDISPNQGFKGRVCQTFLNECLDQSKNDCDRNGATCRDTEDSYVCQCKQGYTDRSPNKLARPGRVCLKLENECLDRNRNTCDRNAECRDLEDGYTCECRKGFRDQSPNALIQPGRVCVAGNCPTNHECSSAATCSPTAQGYDCSCIQGYVDQSGPGKRPGSVCVRENDCLYADLNECSPMAQCINLVGIGSYVCECMHGYIQLGGGRLGSNCVPINNTVIRPELIATVSPQFITDASTDPKPISVKPTKSSVVPGWPFLGHNFDNECLDARQNNCSRNAICYDLPVGFRCECKRGYEDRVPSGPQWALGRICEPPKPIEPPKPHPCQDPLRNDCARGGGVCSSTDTRNGYTCKCLPGYKDLSTDPNKPGRICEVSVPVCLDPSQNDCHDYAICTANAQGGKEKYSCRCRDGYVDLSVDPNRPGRVCKPDPNECLDASLNDCDPNALCTNLARGRGVVREGYRCECNPGYLDRSPDQNRRGRKCLVIVNECETRIHDCSRFADCIDQEEGFRCRCRTGYHDENPNKPGRICKPIINECEFPNLNTCDKRFATCIDKPGGYTCACKQPYRDESPNRAQEPGRICRYNECQDRNLNDCHRDAICQDLADQGYICHCKEGFVDSSADPVNRPGRICIRGQSSTKIPPFTTPPVTPPCVGCLPCGANLWCKTALGERCVPNPFRCQCPVGQKRRNGQNQPCVDVDRIDMTIRVGQKGNSILSWGNDYGNPNNPAYLEIVHVFQNGMDGTITPMTRYRPYFIRNEVDKIFPPRFVNPHWTGQGLMFNYSVYVTPGSNIDRCQLHKDLIAQLKSWNLRMGGPQGELAISAEQPSPCPPEGEKCGSGFCQTALREVCIRNTVCDCPDGLKRSFAGAICQEVDSWPLPMWVVRHGERGATLKYNQSFVNTNDPLYRRFIELFKEGINFTYSQTPTSSRHYVTIDNIDIVDPSSFNGTWNHGILFKFVCHFKRNAVQPSIMWGELIQTIIQKFNYEVGQSDLYISPYMEFVNPFGLCYRPKIDCDSVAWCFELPPNSYRCQCPPNYFDPNPNLPGRTCTPIRELNECLHPTLNQCHANARCYDLTNGYRCECQRPYVDVTPVGKRRGSQCEIDYCSDLNANNICTVNATCVNSEQEGICKCNPGFIDISNVPKEKIFQAGLITNLRQNVICLRELDIDECLLGLHNCSSVAICEDKAIGYSCRCPKDHVDGSPDPALKGRVCASVYSSKCGGRGTAIYTPLSDTYYCQCQKGYSGERCEVATGNVRLILVIILALIFLLLCLCCCIFFCLKCRCVKGKGLWYREPLFTYRKGAWPWSTLEHSTSSESGEGGFSGMSSAMGKGSDYYPEMAIPRAKLKEQRLDAGQLQGYLDEGALKIPRAHISRTSSVEQDGQDTVIYSGAHRRRADSDSDSESGSSAYTIREEIERRVITDINTTETKRTITADVHGGGESSAQQTTAHFNVHAPPDGSNRKAETGGVVKGLLKFRQQQRGNRTQLLTGHSSHDESTAGEEEDVRSVASSSSCVPSTESSISITTTLERNDSRRRLRDSFAERDRGQSIAEFSVGGLQSRTSDWGETGTEYSRNRELSEYTERDDASDSGDSQATYEVDPDVFDKRVLTTQREDRVPGSGPGGSGGVNRFTTEVTTTTKSRESNPR